MSSFLFHFSKYFLVPFFTEWLSPNDVVILNVSLNKNGLKVFESLVKEYPEKFVTDDTCVARISLNAIRSKCEKSTSLPGGLIVTTSFLIELNNCKHNSIFDMWTRKFQMEDCVLSYFAKLKRIELFPIGKDLMSTLKLFLSWCINLEEVQLAGTPVAAASILKVICDSCPKLHALHISSIMELDRNTLKLCLDKCSGLQDLRLGDVTNPTDPELIPFIVSLYHNYPSLSSLHFTAGGNRLNIPFVDSTPMCFVSLTCDYLDSSSLHTFIRNGGAEHLLYLDISRCRLSPASTFDICSCRNLKKLVVHAQLVAHGDFKTKCIALTNLTTLHAVQRIWNHRFNHSDVVTSAVLLTGLTELSVPCCGMVTQESYPNLTSLTLCDVTEGNTFKEILAAVRPKLVSLTVVMRPNTNRASFVAPTTPLFDHSLSAVVEGVAQYCKELRRLMMWDWYITPVITHQPDQLQLLEEVGVHVALRTKCVVELLRNCPKIRKLHLLCNVNMNLTEWNALIDQGSNLLELHLIMYYPGFFESERVDSQILRNILMKCKRLRKLYVRGCRWKRNAWFEQEIQKLKPDCLVCISTVSCKYSES